MALGVITSVITTLFHGQCLEAIKFTILYRVFQRDPFTTVVEAIEVFAAPPLLASGGSKIFQLLVDWLA
jgi:hypothetical protein